MCCCRLDRCERILRLLRCGRYWRNRMLTVSNFPTSAPVSNLKFLSKLVEKSVFVQLNNYLTVNGLHKRFQSAYKAHHSTETALLTITNDISYCHWTGGTICSYCYWNCQRHMIRLIILCYFRVWKTWHRGNCSGVVSFISVWSISVSRNWWYKIVG